MVEYILDIENEFEGWKPDEKEILEKTKRILSHYLATPEVYDNSCLVGPVLFGFLFHCYRSSLSFGLSARFWVC